MVWYPSGIGLTFAIDCLLADGTPPAESELWVRRIVLCLSSPKSRSGNTYEDAPRDRRRHAGDGRNLDPRFRGRSGVGRMGLPGPGEGHGAAPRLLRVVDRD